MGRLTQFEIFLENSQGVFQPGQLVNGHVVVCLDQPMEMRAIRLQICGGAHVRWRERHTTGSGNKRRTTHRTYWNAEEYINIQITLYGKAPGQSGDNPEHPSGQHSYPFSFQLPPTAPTSFEGAHGRVRYWLKATIDRPWKFDHSIKMAFTVIGHLDLNTVPNTQSPVSGSNEKTLCCLCCASGPIEATFKLDRCGYVPGEHIMVHAEVANHSNRKMQSSHIILMQRIGFHATRKSRWTQQNVAELMKGPIEAGGTDNYDRLSLHIPPVPASFLTGCRIIDVEYSLTFVVQPKGPALSLDVPVPVIIGTIPLQNVFAAYSQGPFNTVYNTLPSAPPTEPQATNAGPPPPSYAQCVFGATNIKDDDDNDYTKGEMSYAPVYPYYAWE